MPSSAEAAGYAQAFPEAISKTESTRQLDKRLRTHSEAQLLIERHKATLAVKR